MGDLHRVCEASVHKDHHEQAHSRSFSGILRCRSVDDDRERSGRRVAASDVI
jgi:hypothetical protein